MFQTFGNSRTAKLFPLVLAEANDKRLAQVVTKQLTFFRTDVKSIYYSNLRADTKNRLVVTLYEKHERIAEAFAKKSKPVAHFYLILLNEYLRYYKLYHNNFTSKTVRLECKCGVEFLGNPPTVDNPISKCEDCQKC